MKTTRGSSQQGGTLVMTVITSALIGSVLCSYLVLISSRNEGAMRAMAWNSAIPVLEAGIEEGLTHLQLDSNPTANQWRGEVIKGKKVYWKRRDLPDGSYFYVTNINVGSGAPVVVSAGYVRAPLQDNKFISRVVKVTTTNAPSVFTHAIAATGTIQLSGDAVIDGYNSSVGRYSPTNRNAAGNIATDSQAGEAIKVGQAHIYGKAVTGPDGGVSAAGGSVGDLDWPSTAGIQPGATNNDMNVQFQAVPPPTGPQIPVPYTHAGGSNVAKLNSDGSSVVYTMDKFISNNSKQPMIVTGHATLVVTGDFVVNNTGYVYIAPGGSLTLYVGGRAIISGGGVVNDSVADGYGLPKDFTLNGLSTSTVINYSGLADFIGTINAPQADINFTGSATIYGAVICNSFASTGTTSVHYDQSLGAGGMFLVTSWREM